MVHITCTTVWCTSSVKCTCTYHSLYDSIVLYFIPCKNGGIRPINVGLYGHISIVVSYMPSPIHERQLLSYKRLRRPHSLYIQVYERVYWQKTDNSEQQAGHQQRTQLWKSFTCTCQWRWHHLDNVRIANENVPRCDAWTHGQWPWPVTSPRDKEILRDEIFDIEVFIPASIP